jgi:hypothetical protein
MKKKVDTPARFTRASFLLAATTLMEDVIPAVNISVLGLGDVPIRELTAAQRLEAIEVAKVFDADGEEVALPDGTTKIDATKYWASLITMSLLDPNTCYEGETFQEGRGQLLLTPDDIFDLAERGKEVLQPLAQRILNLSWMTKPALFRSGGETDNSESAQGAGDGAADTGDEPEGMEPGDDGAVLGDE